jgi:transcriptional regulator GlxA family with amidase domain
MTTVTRRIGIVLVPEFALASFSMIIEPLRVANRLSGQLLYQWSLLSGDGGPVASSAGIDLLTEPVARTRDTIFDLALVCAGFHAERYRHAGTLNWLRRHRRLGSEVGAVSTGTFVLARAGLLVGHRCTVHWDFRGALAELYPEQDIVDELFVIDRGIVTSGGSIAALDLMLRLIADQQGLAFSKAVGEQFVHSGARGPDQHQRGDLIHRLGTAKPMLIEAVKRMENVLDRALSPADIAAKLGISQRQMERQFRSQLGRTPIAYHRDIRLDHARRLLSQTTLPVTEIALSCGFGSASHFARLYRQRFGRLPTADRGGLPV